MSGRAGIQDVQFRYAQMSFDSETGPFRQLLPMQGRMGASKINTDLVNRRIAQWPLGLAFDWFASWLPTTDGMFVTLTSRLPSSQGKTLIRRVKWFASLPQKQDYRSALVLDPKCPLMV